MFAHDVNAGLYLAELLLETPKIAMLMRAMTSLQAAGRRADLKGGGGWGLLSPCVQQKRQ